MVSKRRFVAQRATIDSDLKTILAKMDATNGRVDLDITARDRTVTIIFDRAGTRYVFRCAKWPHQLDNYRAAQLTIDYLWRAMEHYGTTREELAGLPLRERQERQRQSDQAFAQLFAGFTPLPDDTALLLGDGNTAWWDVLGVARNADRRTIEGAYRALVKVHHPDMGGSPESFVRLRRAYEAGVQAAAA